MAVVPDRRKDGLRRLEMLRTNRMIVIGKNNTRAVMAVRGVIWVGALGAQAPPKFGANIPKLYLKWWAHKISSLNY